MTIFQVVEEFSSCAVAMSLSHRIIYQVEQYFIELLLRNFVYTLLIAISEASLATCLIVGNLNGQRFGAKYVFSFSDLIVSIGFCLASIQMRCKLLSRRLNERFGDWTRHTAVASARCRFKKDVQKAAIFSTKCGKVI